MKDYVFFDLDGTLTDSHEGIFNSIRNALNFFEIKKTDEELRVFIGPPLKETFIKTIKLSQEETKIAIDKFHEYYEEKGLFENQPYKGIKELLANLKSKGKHLVVATSKPESTSKRILEHFNLSNFFEHICGSNMDETRSDKAEVISYAMETCGLSKKDKDRIIMIGDRQNDIFGAHKNEIQVAAVLYGFGNKEEFLNAKADYIINSVNDLNIFLENI